MVAAQPVTLERATPADAALLSNLLELYIHDLSEISAVEVGTEGRFGYEKLRCAGESPNGASHF